MKYIFFITLLLNVSVFLEANPELQKGYEAIEHENFNEAQTHFEYFLDNQKTRASAFLGLGEVALAQKELKCAEKYFSNACTSNTHSSNPHPAMHRHIAEIYLKYGHLEKKIKHEKRAKILGEPLD